MMSVRTPELADVSSFSMREMDAMECLRGGMAPRAALAESIKGSTLSFLVSFDGDPAVMWGYRVYTLCPSVAAIWMLTSPAVEDHKWEFIREMRRMAKVLDAHFTSYHCAVWKDYVSTRRLLALLNFKEVGGFVSPEFVIMERKGRPLWVN